MLKNIVLFFALLGISLEAASNEKIVEYFKSQVAGEFDINVTNRQKLPNYPEFEFAQIEISRPNSANETAQKINIFIKGDLIFPEIVDLDKNISLKQKAEERLLLNALGTIYKKESPSNIITIGNSAKKPYLLIFSAPESANSKEELSRIEERLGSYNIKMILTPTQGRSSLEKSVLIYDEIKGAKTDKDKIAILRKYYNKTTKIEGVADNEKVKKLDTMRQEYFKAGLESVPLIIEERKLAGSKK